MKMSSAKKILCLVQLPPPIHGAAVMNRHIVDNVLPISNYDYIVVPLNFSRSFDDMHGGIFSKAIKAILTLFKLIKELIIFRPNIIYFTFAPFGFALFRDIIYVFICRLFSVPILLHLHGTGLSNKKTKMYKKAYGYLLGKNRLILPSEKLYNDVSLFIDRKHCFILSNAVNSAVGFSGCKQVNKKIIDVIYIANFDPRKGLLTAINVFDKLIATGIEARLHLVGAYTFYWSEEQMHRYLEKFSESTRLKIIMHGALYKENKNKVLSIADIFFYPSAHDAFPLVVLEALSFGLPVVASMQGAIPDIIQDGENGFVCKADDDVCYLDILQRLSTDSILRDKIGKSALSSYIHNYSFPVFDKKLILIFDELCGNACYN